MGATTMWQLDGCCVLSPPARICWCCFLVVSCEFRCDARPPSRRSRSGPKAPLGGGVQRPGVGGRVYPNTCTSNDRHGVEESMIPDLTRHSTAQPPTRTGRPGNCFAGGGWHGRPAKEAGGGFQKWASVPGPLFCVRTDVATKGAGTQILAWNEKIFPPHMCSQNDQRDVGIILSHICWGWTPPPPPPRHGR